MDPITLSENANFWRECLLQVIRQNIANKLLKTKGLLEMFCLMTWSKLSCQLFEFSLKVMESNPGYLHESFLLYPFSFWSIIVDPPDRKL